MKTFKVTRIKEDGTREIYCHFINDYSAFENAVTLNMQLHGIGNILDKNLRIKFAKGIEQCRFSSDRAFIDLGTDVYFVTEAR